MADVTDSDSGYSTEKVEAQDTFPAGVNIRRGQVMFPDPTTGKWKLAAATSAAAAGGANGYLYFAVKTVKANEALTGNLIGLASYGDAFDAMNYWDPIYLSNTPGELSSTVGTYTRALGVVYPDWRETTPQKLMRFK